MPRPDARQWGWAYLLPLLAAGYLFCLTVYVIASRVAYPYELEWIEGGMLQPAVRLAQGLPLYVEPSMAYVPPLYAPLYFLLSSWSIDLFGAGLPALRAVSVLAAAGTALLVAWLAHSLTRSRLAACLALAGWGVMFRYSGFWYDVARSDSLWTFCLVACLAASWQATRTPGRAPVWLAGAALLAALYAKQTTLAWLPFYAVALWAWWGWRRAALLLASVAGLALLLGLWLQQQSDGLFAFYTLGMAQSHKATPGWPTHFLLGDLLLGVPAWLVLAGLFLCLPGPAGRQRLGWLAVLLGVLLMSLLSRWYSGGFLNVLMPLHQVLVVLGVAGLAGLVQWVARAPGLRRYLLAGVPYLLLLANLALAWFHADWAIPTDEDRACGDRLLQQIAAVPGPVCISRHPYLAFLAGKEGCAHEAFAVDLLNGRDKVRAGQFVADLTTKLTSGYYPVLVMNNHAQFEGYGVSVAQLAYTATGLDCPQKRFYPVVAGPRPHIWAVYNGRAWEDRRPK